MFYIVVLVQKTNNWIVSSELSVVGPLFFQENTINGNIYLDMFENFALPQLEELQPNIIFQQDQSVVPLEGVCS